MAEATWSVRDVEIDEEIPQWTCQDSEEDGWGDEEGRQ
jgi:hypothetical protein